MKCPVCGTENPDNHKFCSECAYPLSKADNSTKEGESDINTDENPRRSRLIAAPNSVRCRNPRREYLIIFSTTRNLIIQRKQRTTKRNSTKSLMKKRI